MVSSGRSFPAGACVTMRRPDASPDAVGPVITQILDERNIRIRAAWKFQAEPLEFMSI
jgi:hypothetical protein